jgi:general secretion pathway protein H
MNRSEERRRAETRAKPADDRDRPQIRGSASGRRPVKIFPGHARAGARGSLRCGRPTIRSGGAPHGFTLIELLVVLAIIGLMLLAVPKIVAGMPGVQLRTAADDMVATLRQLHETAIRRQITTGIVLDLDTRTYRLSTAAGTSALPSVVTGVGFTTVAFSPGERTAHILFYADGSASGGTIRLRHGALTASIRVDWLTGRVGRHD